MSKMFFPVNWSILTVIVSALLFPPVTAEAHVGYLTTYNHYIEEGELGYKF